MARSEIKSEITGSVWKILAAVGTKVEAGDSIMIIESMKMEIPVVSEHSGVVIESRVNEGDTVDEGAIVAVVET